MPPRSLRRLSRRLTLVVIVYFFAGSASQKLLPGDEIIPFSGWSLFSKVPNEDSRYQLLIHRHAGREIDPPEAILRAPATMVAGSRYVARKVVQRLGQAHDRGDGERVDALRRLLEENHLIGDVGYELVFERYDPLETWRTGSNLEQRSMAFFERPQAR